MNGMFARIMAVVLAAILTLAVCLSAFAFMALRTQQINARLDYLSSEAEDIAYLAANLTGSMGGYSSTAQKTLNWKVKKVSEEFGAYIAVVDSRGSVMDNAQIAYSQDPDFMASLSGEEVMEALKRVLTGESIRLQTTMGEDPVFTVGAPFIRNEVVEGAVFIQTKAQQIESGLSDILLKVGLLSLGVFLLSGVAVFCYVRTLMRPLTDLTRAAAALSRGEFTARVADKRGDRQMRDLCSTFNTMAERLGDMEESRREFVANVSHEFRSPITSIKGFAEGMADGVIPEEDHPRYLRLVADESKRLSTLVGDLLVLSRLEKNGATLNYTDFDMNEMLRRAIIRRMNDLDGKNLDVDCDFGEDPCPVHADADRIEQVVINLLDNAIKFTPQDGRIVLSTRKQDKLVSVTVQDNGQGIPAEDRDKVFDRFFTSDRAHTSGKGTGLGLSISQRIMEMHKQTIRLLDTQQGAAFCFTLEAGSLPLLTGKQEALD